MKTLIEMAPAGDMTLQTATPAAQINHLQGKSQAIPAHQGIDRPHILERRAARWARRVAYS